MSSFSDEMAAVAVDLLTDFGETVSLDLNATTGYNTSTGLSTGDSATTVTGKAVPIDYSSAEINNTTVLQGDIRLYIEFVSEIVEVNDTVVMSNGERYRVVNSIRYKLNAASLLYELQLRR